MIAKPRMYDRFRWPLKMRRRFARDPRWAANYRRPAPSIRDRGNAGHWMWLGKLAIAEEGYERTLVEAAGCVPAIGGSLTLARVRAGWRLHLRCPRGCVLSTNSNPTMHLFHSAGPRVFVSHCCAAPREELHIPDQLPAPVMLHFEPDGEPFAAYVFTTTVLP